MNDNIKQHYIIKDRLIELKLQIEEKNILVIYGRHINGFFIALPNLYISCEALSSNEIQKNTYYLSQAGLGSDYARMICTAINDFAEGNFNG